jgi:hypothetical protein
VEVELLRRHGGEDCSKVFFWEGLSQQAKQRSAPPKEPRACLSQAPAKRGVCAFVPAALLPVDATHVAAVRITPAVIPCCLCAAVTLTVSIVLNLLNRLAFLFF